MQFCALGSLCRALYIYYALSHVPLPGHCIATHASSIHARQTTKTTGWREYTNGLTATIVRYSDSSDSEEGAQAPHTKRSHFSGGLANHMRRHLLTP